MDNVIDRVREKAAALASRSFAGAEILKQLSAMNRSQLDALDFGVVKVDNNGKIELYNRYEAELASIEPAKAEGKNFFREVAPCTNNSLFYGTFKDCLAKGEMNHLFIYTFTYKMRPTNVNVHLYRDKAAGKNFILVQRR